MSGIQKLESIQKFVRDEKNVTFIFFDTETTGLITKVGDTFFNTSLIKKEDEEKKLNELLKEKKIPLEEKKEKEIYSYLVKRFDIDGIDFLPRKKNIEKIDFLKQSDINKFYKNKQSDIKIQKQLEEVYRKFKIWKQSLILRNRKNKIELTEFAAVKFTISFNGEKYKKTKNEIIHKYFKPEKMSDEIKKLTHWGPEKDVKGSIGIAGDKYQEIIDFFNNTQGITVIVAHNLLGFDLPAMTLFLKNYPDQLNEWNTFLHKGTTYALDTKDIANYFKIQTSKFPEIFNSFEKIPNTNFMRSNQVYLQQLTNITNKSQHTAIEDVRSLVKVVKRLFLVFYYLNNSKKFEEHYNSIVSSNNLDEIKKNWKSFSTAEKNIYRGFATSMLKKKFPQEDIVLEKAKTDVTFTRARKFVNTQTKSSEKRKKFMAVFSAVKKSMLDSGQPIGIAIATGYKRAKESVGIQK